MSIRKPLIGIPADRRLLGDHYFHCVGEKYIRAVAEGAGAAPVLIPSLGDALDTRELLADCDGILLTGSVETAPLSAQYGPAPEVELTRDGILHRLAACRSRPPRPTALSKPSACATRRRSRSPCNGIRSGSFPRNPFSPALFAAFGRAARERALKACV